MTTKTKESLDYNNALRYFTKDGLQDYVNLARDIANAHLDSNNDKVRILATTLETTLDMMQDIINDPESAKVKYKFGRVGVPATPSREMISRIKGSSYAASLLSSNDAKAIYRVITENGDSDNPSCRIGGIKRSGMLCGKYNAEHGCQLTSPCKNQV